MLLQVDLLLLLLRDVLARRAAAAAAAQAAGRPPPTPLKLVLMSATADAQLFADYMSGSSSAASAGGKRGKGGHGKGGQQGAEGSGSGVGQLVIPGFTYPVREFYLEDILEMTHTVVSNYLFIKQAFGTAKKYAAPLQI